MTPITCRLTTKNRDQLRNPTLGNRVWVTFLRLSLGYWDNPYVPRAEGCGSPGRAVSMNLDSSTVVVTSPLATSSSRVRYTNRQFGHQRTNTKRIAIVRSLVNGCLDVLSSFLSSLSTHYFSEIYSSARYNNCLNCAHSTVSNVGSAVACRGAARRSVTVTSYQPQHRGHRGRPQLTFESVCIKWVTSEVSQWHWNGAILLTICHFSVV